MSSNICPTIPTERGMRIAEQRIPAMAATAGRDAYKNRLEHTGAVTVKTARGQVVRRQRDGSVTVINGLPIGKRVNPEPSLGVSGKSPPAERVAKTAKLAPTQLAEATDFDTIRLPTSVISPWLLATDLWTTFS